MDCRTAAMLLQPCFDGELDEGTAAAVRAHVAGCADCGREMASLQALREAMKRSLPRYAAPQSLRDRLKRPPAMAGTAAAPPLSTKRLPPRWLAIAASLMLAASLGAGLGAGLPWRWMLPGSTPVSTELLLHDLVSSHLRALAASSSVDVLSSDRHTVRPWFAGRVEVAPPAIDLSAQGFELVGGRVDYVGARRVAVLVYKHGQHMIDLFVLPDDMPEEGVGETAVGPVARQGLSLIHRRVGDVQVWAVSDLDSRELAAFGDALASAR